MLSCMAAIALKSGEGTEISIEFYPGVRVPVSNQRARLDPPGELKQRIHYLENCTGAVGAAVKPICKILNLQSY